MSEPRIRVAALIRRGDDLLLIKHAKLGRTYWLLPGGGVEEGESMHEALLRELDEECSLRSVRLEGPIAIAESIAPANERPRKHVVHLIFAGTVADDQFFGHHLRGCGGSRPPAGADRGAGLVRPASAHPPLSGALDAGRPVRASGPAVGALSARC